MQKILKKMVEDTGKNLKHLENLENTGRENRNLIEKLRRENAALKGRIDEMAHDGTKALMPAPALPKGLFRSYVELGKLKNAIHECEIEQILPKVDKLKPGDKKTRKRLLHSISRLDELYTVQDLINLPGIGYFDSVHGMGDGCRDMLLASMGHYGLSFGQK